jgi:hypothetical protein
VNRLHATELQAARRAAAERYFEIAMFERPSGWSYTFRSSLTGCCNHHEKRIEAPRHRPLQPIG